MTLLVPMQAAAFADYMAKSIPEYARDKVVSGQWSEEAALELSRQGFEALLPQGFATPDNYIFEIHADAKSIGILWFAVQDRAGERIAYVYDIMIDPAHQRQGHGSRVFEILEAKARELGLSGIALHVFGHNPDAHALYVRLGFRPTNISMFKPL